MYSAGQEGIYAHADNGLLMFSSMISFVLNVIQTTGWGEMQDSGHWYLEPSPATCSGEEMIREILCAIISETGVGLTK